MSKYNYFNCGIEELERNVSEPALINLEGEKIVLFDFEKIFMESWILECHTYALL